MMMMMMMMMMIIIIIIISIISIIIMTIIIIIVFIITITITISIISMIIVITWNAVKPTILSLVRPVWAAKAERSSWLPQPLLLVRLTLVKLAGRVCGQMAVLTHVACVGDWQLQPVGHSARAVPVSIHTLTSSRRRGVGTAHEEWALFAIFGNPVWVFFFFF